MKRKAKTLYVAEYINQADRTWNGMIVHDGNGHPMIDSNAAGVKDMANDLHGMKYRRTFVVVPYDRRKGW